MKNKDLAALLLKDPEAEAVVKVREIDTDLDRFHVFGRVTEVWTTRGKDLDHGNASLANEPKVTILRGEPV